MCVCVGVDHVKLALPFLDNEDAPTGATFDEKDVSIFHNHLLIIALINKTTLTLFIKIKVASNKDLEPLAKSWVQSRPYVDSQIKVWGVIVMRKELKSPPQFIRVHHFSVRVCMYHLSRCMLASFSGSVGGNMVGRICVWRLLGTWDQSGYHWPSLVISYGRQQPFKVCGPIELVRTLSCQTQSDFKAEALPWLKHCFPVWFVFAAVGLS